MSKIKPNYRIIRIEKLLKKYGFLNRKTFVDDVKITMTKFYAKDDDEAYKYLQEYKKVANKAYDYYYDTYQPIIVTDRKGKKHEFENEIEKWRFEDNDVVWYKKVLDALLFNLEFYFIDRPKDLWYWFKSNIYLLKNKHQYGEHWSLDSHILEDLKWNVPILNKNSHGFAFPYLDKAIKEIHGSEKNFDINEWNKTHILTDSSKETNLAAKYQEESRNELLKYVKLYEYYRDRGITNDKEFDKKWHHTLPVKKGTYDRIEYDKIDALQKKYWNKIWEWMRMYGETLWD